MGLMQPWHLIIILIVVLIIFGPGKLPQAGKALGQAIGEFKRSANAHIEEPNEEKKE